MDPGDSGSSAPQGLALVEDAIADVIKQINDELDQLNPEAFAFGALIQNASFGAADSAPKLALHYDRAHQVIWKTLRGVKEDLIAFQDSCREAVKEIKRADEESAAQMQAAQSAVEVLSTGALTDKGAEAHHQARQDQDVTAGGSDT